MIGTPSSAPQRFECAHSNEEMHPASDGGWVRWADVQHLFAHPAADHLSLEWAADVLGIPRSELSVEQFSEYQRARLSAAVRGARAALAMVAGLNPEPVAWAIYDSQGFYETRDTEEQAREFCRSYNQRPERADDPLRPYTFAPLYAPAQAGLRTPLGEPDAWMSRDGKNTVTAEDKRRMLNAGFGVWAEVAQKYTIPLFKPVGIGFVAKKLATKYHDGSGNLAEIETNPSGKLFVRLVRPGVSKMEIVAHNADDERRHQTIYGTRNEGEREPDLAYDCFEGTTQEVAQFLRDKGFPVGEIEDAGARAAGAERFAGLDEDHDALDAALGTKTR